MTTVQIEEEEELEGVAATHGKRRPLRVLAAPAHPGERHCNTVRPSRLPLACWRMNASRFDFDSSVVVPAARRELSELRRLRERHPTALASIFGHADPTGDDEYNKRLSGRRAEAVYALLTRRVDLWEALYRVPHGGDQWGRRSLQRMLAALTDAEGEPYFDGLVTRGWSADWYQSVHRFQEDQGIGVDGDPGPETRGVLFAAYMEYLCTGEDGSVLRLEPTDFLGRGADAGGRMAYQGCGEMNPVMRFSQSEEAEYAAWSKRDERNEKNRVNRRLVVYLFDPAAAWPHEAWPCPPASEGTAACTSRFFSDHGPRAQPGPSTRHFDGDADTFRCRFYHRLSFNSPCEQPNSATVSLDIWLRTHPGRRRLKKDAEGFVLASTDGSYTQRLSSADAVPVSDEHLLVRFTGLSAAKRYGLYQEHDRFRFAVFEDIPYAELETSPPLPPPQPAPVPTDEPEPSERPEPDEAEDVAEWTVGATDG